jgi:hypothetical protein
MLSRVVYYELTDISEILPSLPYDDGGSNDLRNVGLFLQDYTVQHPRKPSLSSIGILNTQAVP